LLLAGERASICDGCVAFAVAQLDDPTVTPSGVGTPALRASIHEVLSRMSADTPFAQAGPVLAAAAALAKSMAERHNLSLEAIRVRNPHAALILLDVPDATPTMVMNASTYWIAPGEPARAVERLRALAAGTLNNVDEAHLP
jgi:hypothetical protein